MKTLIEKIRNARVGKECREPIAQALSILHDLASVKIENAEVVEARKYFANGAFRSYDTIGERINVYEGMIINEENINKARSADLLLGKEV